MTNLWSGSGVEQTMEKLGHDGGRLENLITLRSNRSVDYILMVKKEKKRTALDASSVARVRDNIYTTRGSSDKDSHGGSRKEGELGEHV